MIKDNQKSINRFQVVLDGLVMVTAYAAAWFIRIGGGFFAGKREALPPVFYLTALVIAVPVYLALYGIFHLYVPKRVQSRRAEFANICKANILGLLLFTLVLYLNGRDIYLQHFPEPMVRCCSVGSMLCWRRRREM